jgi:hypothetical protein
MSNKDEMNSDGALNSYAQLNFGEDLVAQVLKVLIRTGRLKGYPFKTDNKKVTPIEVFAFGKNSKISSNTPMDQIVINGESRNFNKLHNIDISILSKKVIYPIEVKMGKSNRCEKFPATFFKFKKNPIQKNKSNKELSGNMINILDHRFCNKSVLKLKSEKVHIHDNWSIVIRSDAFNFWKKADGKGFNKLQYVFVFEEMWKLLKPKEKSQIKSEVVKSLKIQLSGLDSI